LALEGKPIINMGIGSPDLRPSQSVIDAVKLALEDENAHQYRVIRDCQNCEKYG
jgi:aspartate/methionine/tyrosine aminotransferase